MKATKISSFFYFSKKKKKLNQHNQIPCSHLKKTVPKKPPFVKMNIGYCFCAKLF